MSLKITKNHMNTTRTVLQKTVEQNLQKKTTTSESSCFQGILFFFLALFCFHLTKQKPENAPLDAAAASLPPLAELHTQWLAVEVLSSERCFLKNPGEPREKDLFLLVFFFFFACRCAFVSDYIKKNVFFLNYCTV